VGAKSWVTLYFASEENCDENDDDSGGCVDKDDNDATAHEWRTDA